MSVRDWIVEREISGISTFSFEELYSNFAASSEQAIKNELYRLSRQKIIVSVYKGFYVIMPPHYAAKGAIPPMYYIAQLMKYLRKPYYISLLNAAEILGAAHQRPQKFNVTTLLPKPSVSLSRNGMLTWIYRKKIPHECLLTKNSETDIITYSNPELTAIDLVQYEHYVGGLSRAATILEELTEKTDFSKLKGDIFEYTSNATIQRLGYILEEILDQKQQADTLYQLLCFYAKRLKYTPLTHQCSARNINRNSKWKININLKIEIDEI